MPKFSTALAVSLLIVCMGAPAYAIEELTPDPTQRYFVVDVAQDDVLNIRAQPDPASDVVGALNPDASGVVVAGTRMERSGSIWWQVVTAEGEGWVNARFLSPLDQPADDRESFPLQCSGTEPFWSVSLDEGEARFETPMSEPLSWQAAPMSYASGLLGRFAVRLENKGDIGHLAAWRNHRFCSDGMSDIGYPFEGVLIAPDGAVYGGCCRRAGE